MPNTRAARPCLALLVLAFVHPQTAAAPLLDVVDAVLRADEPFPQYVPLWTENWTLQDVAGEALQYAARGMPLGGGVHVYVRSSGHQPVVVEDVQLEDLSLRQSLAPWARKLHDMHPVSLFFSDLQDVERARLIEAGEPVWWRVDPNPVPPNGFAEVYVRLRGPLGPRALRLSLRTPGGPVGVAVRPRSAQPSFRAIHFGANLDRVFLYLRHPSRGQAPKRVFLDGENLTAQAIIGDDAAVDVTPVVLSLPLPLTRGSSHCFQATFADGEKATASLRAFADPFVYGMWGYRSNGDTPGERAREYLTEWQAHNLNTHMGSYGPGVKKWLGSAEGRRFCADTGLRAMTSAPGNVDNPFAYFLMDEPDCRDYRVEDLDPQRRVGALAQPLSEKSRQLREKDPATPHLLNVDLTFKPDNWYTYGQLPDVMAADPYYLNRLKDSYWSHPSRLPLYTRPLYVYAIGRVCRSACAPRPLHLILNSCSWDDQANGRRFRYSTPEEKRIEAYYALAAGATGLSYWWFTPYGTCHGCGAAEEPARALLREIGLLGAELRTAGPVLVTACPVDLPSEASRHLWVRTLLSGADTLIVLCVNDDHLCDRDGTVVRPLEGAKLSVRLPAWLSAPNVFEVTFEGAREVSHAVTDGRVSFDLGAVELTRMLLVTADSSLRGKLGTKYAEEFAEPVRRLMAARKGT